MSLDLRGLGCEDFIAKLTEKLTAMRQGDEIELRCDKDRALCLQPLLRGTPYLWKYELVGDHAVVKIKKLR